MFKNYFLEYNIKNSNELKKNTKFSILITASSSVDSFKHTPKTSFGIGKQLCYHLKIIVKVIIRIS